MSGFYEKADVIINAPKSVLMEDTFECTVEVIPGSDITLRKVEIELYCQETSITRSTTDYYNHKKIFSDERIPTKEIQLKTGNNLKYREVFTLPSFTTPTFYAHNHYVEWFVRVRLDVPWWFDTRREQSIVVLPYMAAPELFIEE